MRLLVAATFLLVVSHLLPSAPRVRERLLVHLGPGGFYAWYSLLSLLALAAVIWAYQAAGPAPSLYEPLSAGRTIALVGMLLAVFLLVGRLTTRAPETSPIGIYRVTAVPGSLAVLIWTLAHLANRGEARLVVIFGGLTLLSLAALVKNMRQAAPACRRVGWLPFAAVFTGRERLVWAEIGWWRLGVAALAYLALLLLHPILVGPDPLAGLL